MSIQEHAAHHLRLVEQFIRMHGIVPRIVDGRVEFTCYDGKQHSITTMASAMEILGY